MTHIETLKLALEALEEIALAGMSGTGQESDEAMTAWHARQAWKFIGIAARQLPALRQAIEQAEQAQPMATVTSETGADISMSWWHEPALPVGTKLYTAPPAERKLEDKPLAPRPATELRKPLTDEEIGKVFRAAFPKGGVIITDDSITLVRAIERAYGIKGES